MIASEAPASSAIDQAADRSVAYEKLVCVKGQVHWIDGQMAGKGIKYDLTVEKEQ